MGLPEAQDGSSGSNSVDYSAVDLPDTADKPRTEWHYTQRRAEILQLIREAGHPGELNQTELGERYGVSQQQISKDLKRLGESIRQSLDDDRRALAVDAVVQRSIRGLLDEGDYYKAGQLAIEWDSWVSDSTVSMGDRAKDGGGLGGIGAEFV
jgi:DNA-binding transcriptional ArsR family regulator